MKRIVHFGSAAVMAALLAVPATPALAHPGTESHMHDLVAGLLHPLGGLDHTLAMIAVGIWSALVAGRRVWIVPTTFVAAMLAGAGLAQAGIALPAAEITIALSVLVLGALIAAGANLPIAAGGALIALFAVFHGYAHGLEASGAVGGYIAGFAITTALLHVAGIVLGRAIVTAPHVSRLLGAAIVASGAYLVATL